MTSLLIILEEYIILSDKKSRNNRYKNSLYLIYDLYNISEREVYTLQRRGEELGIPTPYNEYTYHMIIALEKKNDGLFDYQGERDKTTWAK